MSLLEIPPAVRTSLSGLDELEDAFVAWTDNPAKPDVVEFGPPSSRPVPVVELLRRLGSSPATLPAGACVQVGLPSGVTIAAAAAELLRATIDPDGPRCRSFRAATYYLRGLSRLLEDDEPDSHPPPPLRGRTGAPRGDA
jgi:hypothetical protein